MGRFDKYSNRIEELFTPDDPNPKGDRKSSTEVKHGGVDRNDPPKDEMQKYWRLFETDPLIREPITAFSREVVEPGWYITADDEETVEELTEWMRECAIIEGEKNKDFTLLARKVIVQREVRGTTLIEKVEGQQSGKVVALYLHNAEEFEVYTHPRTNILIEPNADLPEEVRDDVPKTENGEYAAFVQYDTDIRRWRRRRDEGRATDIPFTTDELIKFTRDADVGEVFGTSRIEAVADRAEARQQKLQDNDAAIASKAYPFWLFKFGTDEEPWEFDEIEEFMEHHDMENFKPSMKQGVGGDVDIDTISGDTADLEQALGEDVNHIVTGMPMPKFALGGYADDVAQPVATAQQQRLRRQIREARRELEAEFTPVLQDVAEERDLNAVDSVQLHIGDPNRPDFEPGDGQTIRYTSDSPQGGGNATPNSGFGSDGNNLPTGNPQQDGKQDPESADPGSDSQPQGDNNGNGSENNSSSTVSEELATLDNWDGNLWAETPTPHGHEEGCPDGQCTADSEAGADSTASLADPRLINTDSVEQSLKAIGADAIMSARDDALEIASNRFSGEGVSREDFENILQNSFERELAEANLTQNAMQDMEGVIQDTLDRLSSTNHNPRIDVEYGLRHQRKGMQFAQNFQHDVEKAARDMREEMRTMVRAGIASGDDWDDIEQRIRNTFDDKTIRNRMALIARMKATNAVESTKLGEYRNDDRIVGYKIINPCSHRTTRLCKDLAACDGGEPATVRFDSDSSPSTQLEGETAHDGFNGFSPLPAVPPYHFNCRSSIAPLTE